LIPENPEMSERLLTWPQMAAMIPFTRQHLSRLERDGLFPQRLQIGANRVAWRETEVMAWIESRARGALPTRECLTRESAA
jgi:prophage regulatory protein